MTYTVFQLKKMRAATREKVFEEHPELREMWENRTIVPEMTPEERRAEEERQRKADWEYLYDYDLQYSCRRKRA